MRYDQLLEAGFPRQPPAEALAAAEQAGFDISKLWFHGSLKRFSDFRLPKTEGIDELGPGIYLTSIKWLANTWARERGVIAICVIRKGPLFDLETDWTTPKNQEILRKGYMQAHIDRWGTVDDVTPEQFARYWKEFRNPHSVANHFLSAVGYIGGYNRSSQIEGQVVVFKPDDVKIVARQGGKAHMASSELD